MQFYELGIDPLFEVSAEHGLGVSDLLDEIVQRQSRQGTRSPAPRKTSSGRAPSRNRERRRKEISVAIVGRPECRQVVAGQSAAPRGAHARQRDARARRATRSTRCSNGTSASSASSTPRASAAQAASRAAASWNRSACWWRGAQSRRPTSSCWWWMPPRARPIRTPRLPAKPTSWAAASSIAANKWDLVKENGPDFYKKFDEELRRQLKFLDYAQVLHISAATGERTPKLLEAIDRVADARMKRVPTPELNRFVRDHGRASARQPGPQAGAHSLRGTDERGAAHLRVLHQRRDVLPLLVPAISAEPDPRRVRVRRHADSHRSASPLP